MGVYACACAYVSTYVFARHVAALCSVLQCIAIRRSALQCVAVLGPSGKKAQDKRCVALC